MIFKFRKSRILKFGWPSLLLLLAAPIGKLLLDFDLVKEFIIVVSIINVVPVVFLLSDYATNDWGLKITLLETREILYEKRKVSQRFSIEEIDFIERRHTFLPRLFIFEFYYYKIILKSGKAITASCLTLPLLHLEGVQMREKLVLLPMTEL